MRPPRTPFASAYRWTFRQALPLAMTGPLAGAPQPAVLEGFAGGAEPILVPSSTACAGRA